jgi:hypothetical protein
MKIFNIKGSLILFFTIFFHLIIINRFPINYEYSFVDVAKYFDTFNNTLLKNYGRVQSNTIVYSFFIFLFSKLLFIENLYVVARILTVSSYIFLYFAIINFNNFYKYKSINKIVLILFLNPIIWIYGYRISVDLLPVSLFFFSVSLFFIKKNKFFIKFISSFLCAISIIMKPFFIFLSLYILFIIFILNKKNYINIVLNFGLYISLSIILLFSYLIWSYYNFGYFVNTINHLIFSDLNIKIFFFNFITYLGITSIYLFPIILFFSKPISTNKIVFTLLLMVIFFIFGFNNNLNSSGEITGINIFAIKNNFIIGIYFSLFIYFIFFAYNNYQNINNSTRKLLLFFLFSVFIYLFILSFFRMTERYVIILVPFLYLFFFRSVSKKLYNSIIIFFIIIDIFLSVRSYNRSWLSEKTFFYLKEHSLISLTEPGPIRDSYDWSLVEYSNKDKTKYEVVNFHVKNYIKKFTNDYFIFESSYYLINKK